MTSLPALLQHSLGPHTQELSGSHDCYQRKRSLSHVQTTRAHLLFEHLPSLMVMRPSVVQYQFDALESWFRDLEGGIPRYT